MVALVATIRSASARQFGRAAASLILGFLVVVAAASTTPRFASADEIILDETSSTIVSGDFSCSKIHSATSGEFYLNPKSTSLTAGELWTFYHNQGITRMDTLVLCMDVTAVDGADIDLTFIEFEIRDSNKPINNHIYSLDRGGDNTLVVPGYEASEYRAEAQLSIDLGFDFMERYSSSSPEKVVLNVKMGAATTAIPEFYITGESKWFSGINMFLLALFAGFWAVVFVILFKLTNPNKTSGNHRLSSDHPRAISA